MTPTRLGIRVPALGDTPDVVRDMSQLGADLDNLFARHIGVTVQQGRPTAADLAVTTTGVGMGISIATGVYYVQDDAAAAVARELVPIYRSAASGATLAASNASLPRIDQVVANKDGSIAILTGTPTSGATLDNRTGALALAPSQARLADILVPAASTTVAAGNIRDRRSWARGAYSRHRRMNVADAVISAIGAPGVAVDTTLMSARVELTGVPVRWRFGTRYGQSSAADVLVIYPRYDAGMVPGDGTDHTAQRHPTGLGGHLENFTEFDPAAPNEGAGQTSAASGSHLIQAFAWVTSGTGTIATNGQSGAIMAIEEILQPSANNGIA